MKVSVFPIMGNLISVDEVVLINEQTIVSIRCRPYFFPSFLRFFQKTLSKTWKTFGEALEFLGGFS